MAKYKFNNEEQTQVINTETGQRCINPSVYLWKDYEDWVAAGGVTDPYKSEAELLAEAKIAKNQEVEIEYVVTCSAPVLTSAGILMKGGESSASTIKGALDRMTSKQKRNPSVNTVRLFDVYGQVHVVSFETAEIIAEEIADVVEDALFDVVQKKLAIASATTIEELN